ncbi:MAG: tetratricopeptide repeat protein [Candidatus Omnitrophota bacterium]
MKKLSRSAILIVIGALAIFYISAEVKSAEIDTDVNIFLGAARKKLNKGDFDGAVESFNSAISLDEKNLEARMGLGYIYLQTGALDKAIEYFTKAISLNNQNSTAYSGLGHSYLRKGDLDKAIEYFTKAISLDEKNPYAYVGLIRAYSSYNDEYYKSEISMILEKLEKIDQSLSKQLSGSLKKKKK